MMVYGCDETNGSWFSFIFFFRMWWISTITAICIFISLWVCEFILFEGISLHDPLLLYGVCMCLLCEWTCKTRSRLFFSSPKGLFGFRFHLFKKFVSIVFPSYNYLLFLFHYYQLELQLNIRFRLWELSTLLFITQMIVAPPTLLLRLVSAMFKNRMLFFFVVVWVECSDFSFYVFMFCSDWLKQRFRKRGAGHILHTTYRRRAKRKGINKE